MQIQRKLVQIQICSETLVGTCFHGNVIWKMSILKKRSHLLANKSFFGKMKYFWSKQSFSGKGVSFFGKSKPRLV